MQLGLVTYNWGKDWDLPTLIRNLQETGFAGVELRSTHKHGVEPDLPPQKRREVQQRFDDSGVELFGLGTACEFHSPDSAVLKKNIDEAKAFVRLCHDCGGTGIKVRPNRTVEGVPPEKTFAQIGRAMNDVAAYAEGFGVEIRLEVHGRGTALLPAIKQIMDVATHPGNVVCWNCNPSDLDGKGLEYNFDLVKKRIGAVHIHDLISPYPWRPFFDLLKKSGYEGWTLVEEGSATADPIRVMKYYRLLWETMVR